MNNYYPLPEWRPQSATLVVWPHQNSDWSPMLAEIEQTYLALVLTITQHQRAIIVYYNEKHKQHIYELCREYNCNVHQLIFICIQTGDTWVRDYGPQILLGTNTYKYINFEFNAWGEQYSCQLDNQFSETFFNYINQRCCEYQRSSFIIEGGNLEFDSQATLLTNIACIKRNNPNLLLDDKDIIRQLSYELSLSHMLTIDVPALKGDDTGGHIDTLARFINDDTIVYSNTENEDNPNFTCSMLLKNQLSALRNKQGNPYTLIPVPLPNEIIQDDDGNYLPANYINFLFINNAIVVPLYGDNHDQAALSHMKSICPEKHVHGVNARHLLKQFGSLHCATLHIPETILKQDII